MVDLFRALSVLAALVAVLLLPEDRLPEGRTAGAETLPVCGIAAMVLATGYVGPVGDAACR